MDWSKVVQSLREEVLDLQAQLPKTPAREVAANATIGASVIILAKLADAIEAGIQS